MTSRALAVVLVTLSGLAASGCGELDPPSARTSSGALEAFCAASVRGTGVVDVETDYIPHVVACENGSADFEALRAQAISARSYLYYKLETAGDVADGTSDQVYSCSRAPSMQHYEAARTTAGEVLTYNGNVIAAFFVAGAIPSASDCVPAAGDRDPTDTEKWVTYNWGNSGDGVVQTPLGWVNPANFRNRGCKSQNGANCLSQHGWGYRDILEFYYGNDIVHEVATGACITPQPPPPPPPVDAWCAIAASGETIVDEADECFAAACKTNTLRDEMMGMGDHQLSAPPAGDDCVGRWKIELAEAGDYAISVYTGGLAPRANGLVYRVVHAGVEDAVLVDQSASEAWAPLGTYRFDAGADQWIELGDLSSAMSDPEARVVFDAIRVRRVVPGEPPVMPVPEMPREPEDPPQPSYGGEDDPDLDAKAAPSGGCTCVNGVRNERTAPVLALLVLACLMFSYSSTPRGRVSRSTCARPSSWSLSSPQPARPVRRTR